MFIVNSESLDMSTIFQCKSLYLMKFLCEHKGLSFIARENFVEVKDGITKNKYAWLFVRTEDLSLALSEWAERKNSKNLLFPRLI